MSDSNRNRNRKPKQPNESEANWLEEQAEEIFAMQASSSSIVSTAAQEEAASTRRTTRVSRSKTKGAIVAMASPDAEEENSPKSPSLDILPPPDASTPDRRTAAELTAQCKARTARLRKEAEERRDLQDAQEAFAIAEQAEQTDLAAAAAKAQKARKKKSREEKTAEKEAKAAEKKAKQAKAAEKKAKQAALRKEKAERKRKETEARKAGKTSSNSKAEEGMSLSPPPARVSFVVPLPITDPGTTSTAPRKRSYATAMADDLASFDSATLEAVLAARKEGLSIDAYLARKSREQSSAGAALETQRNKEANARRRAAMIDEGAGVPVRAPVTQAPGGQGADGFPSQSQRQVHEGPDHVG